ncbi:hypothetical protein OHA37_26805 [Streptomyces sp. NBC_00335]|uniref:hypothetical protein n=1 Tax=unclassified Streptomyces TaxID=2593676 RepID=UPI00224D3BF4|nr:MULTISPECIES: hypothetical protein [unclassified Streptomyces]MCX5407460.1 hypothetical protein [Streptomyces sp. NBC_00086]
MPVRLGRWEIDIFRSVLHIHRGPDPHCPDCDGSGETFHLGIGQADDEAWEISDFCNCWNPVGARIRLWPRRTERVPF